MVGTGLNNFPEFGTLAGLKILLCGTAIAGPFGAGLLGEIGAQVIHFELPKAPDNTHGAYGYTQNHRNQLSMVADTKTPEGREIFLKLIKWTDIFIESSKGGTYNKLGLSDETLWEANPKLAIVHVSGYGQTGDPDYITRASYDSVGQAFSGYMSMNGTKEAMKVSPYLSDYVTGLNTCWTALACYVHTTLTGKGESVDVAQYESLTRITDTRAIEYFVDGKEYPRCGNKDFQAAIFSFYTCKDGGTIFIGMTGHGPVQRGYPIIGLPRPGSGEDPEFDKILTGWSIDTPIGQQMEAAIEKYVSEHTVDEVERVMVENQIPCQRCYSLADCAKDPHFKAREVFTEWDDPMMGRVKGLGIINKWKNAPAEIKWGAPLFGENNADIMRDLGYTDEQIADYAARGITASFDWDQTYKIYRLPELFAHYRDGFTEHWKTTEE